MGRIVVTEFISADGVVEAPGGEPGYQHSGWVGLVPFTEDFGAYKFSEVMEADAHLLGGAPTTPSPERGPTARTKQDLPTGSTRCPSTS